LTRSGGPDLWTVLHLAGQDIVASPSGEYLRRYLGASQLQHWEGTQEEAVAVLRAAAASAPPLADSQAAAALAKSPQEADPRRMAVPELPPLQPRGQEPAHSHLPQQAR
jgi:hypothetical protein